MNLEKLKDTARKFEQKEDWRRAIEVYLKAIQADRVGPGDLPDLSLYNRVGDLYLKANDTASPRSGPTSGRPTSMPTRGSSTTPSRSAARFSGSTPAGPRPT